MVRLSSIISSLVYLTFHIYIYIYIYIYIERERERERERGHYFRIPLSVMKKDFISCHLTRISTRVILGINYVKGTQVKLRCQACVGIERWLEPSHKFVMTLKSPLRTKMTETASFLSQEPTCSCVAWFSK